MQTARVTVLMTPERKVRLDSVAAGIGVSTGEYIRLAVDNFGDATEDAQLAVLVGELNAALPKMAASLDRSIEALEASHRHVDGVLRELGLRA